MIVPSIDIKGGRAVQLRGGNHPTLDVGDPEEVAARCDGREIARHARGFQKGELVLDPVHYLPVLQRKPHALDHAQAFQRWTLPLIYQRFRRELEQRSGNGLREYVEVLSLLRYGRGVDTSAFVDAGFEYRYTTPGTVEAFAKARRLERVVGTPPEYEYERDVEDFLRNSRAVVRPEA